MVQENSFKRFWKYFFGVFKEGRFLLYKYIAASLLMCVVAVLSNMLNVPDLTYLNAFLALNCFSSLIAFGISNGIGVLANQKIDDQEKVKHYCSFGFKINFVFMLAFTALLCAFPKFFMESITGFVPENYTFFYIMCAFFFLAGIKDYITYILKQLKIFKQQLVCECSFVIELILCFGILLLSKNFTLQWIGICYIISAFVTAALGIILLARNKICAINVLSFKGEKLFTKKQWALVLANLAIEFIWQIGYFAVSVCLLRISDAMLNTYSYLENVLDVFNGVFFSFVVVTSIRITRELGHNNFDAAFDHAKKSIYGTVVIWAFYFVMSLIFMYPVALGVNKEYFSIMFTVIPCYVFIHLFRFLSWNFGSYMLRLGGKNTFFLFLEIFSAAWRICLCFISPYISNIFLAYFIIVTPELINLMIYPFIFVRKKWLTNVEMGGETKAEENEQIATQRLAEGDVSKNLDEGEAASAENAAEEKAGGGAAKEQRKNF